MSLQHVRRERLPELQFPLLLPRYAGKLDVRQLADAQLRGRDRSFDDRRHIVISPAVDEKAQGGAAVPNGVHDILFSLLRATTCSIYLLCPDVKWCENRSKLLKAEAEA